MKRIAIFASGGGSNALKFLEYFDKVDDVEISLIVSSKQSAGVLTHAANYDVPAMVLSREYFFDTEELLVVLEGEQVDLIVLAGFLWLVPPYLISNYPDKIVNIHPALLPKYGGRGMYGKHVHNAVKDNKETESGMTIHYVNEQFDEGAHIYQAKCALDPSDSSEVIASKVLVLEHKHYAEIVHQLLIGAI